MTTKTATRIKCIHELQKDCEDCAKEYFINLNGGVRSSKTINWDGEKFWILNQIDDSEQELTPTELDDESLTNIGKAIKLGSFYKYD